jgi:hypothetical protein
MLLTNDFNDLKAAFDVITQLIYFLNNHGLENISKFFRKQKIQSFTQIISSLFLLQNKNAITNREYVTQTFIKNWKNEVDDNWIYIVPITSNELFDWGYSLNNCLNTSEFHNNMMIGEQYIVIAQNKKNKKMLICLRISKITGELLEAKSVNNNAVQDEVLIEINNKINTLFNKTFNVSV